MTDSRPWLAWPPPLTFVGMLEIREHPSERPFLIYVRPNERPGPDEHPFVWGWDEQDDPEVMAANEWPASMLWREVPA